MSNRPFAALNTIDQALRRACPVGPTSEGEQVTITLFSGFELFNTRAYHNYETWSDGYRVSGKGVTIEREDLDDAVLAWIGTIQESSERSAKGESDA